MRRIFFPLSKTAEPGPKKPHTFKMIMPLPYRVRFFCAIQTVNTTPHALVPPLLTPYLPAPLFTRHIIRANAPFTHAALSAPQLLSATLPAFSHKKTARANTQAVYQNPRPFNVRLRLFATGSGTVGKTGADTKIRISVAFVF